jgi:hypothetical protein
MAGGVVLRPARILGLDRLFSNRFFVKMDYIFLQTTQYMLPSGRIDS